MVVKPIKQSVRQPLAIRILLPVLILLLGLLIYLFLQNSQNNLNKGLAAAADYQLLAEIDLAERSYEGDTVATLTLEEPAAVDIYYTIPDIDTAYFDLSLVGVDGGNYLILHSEDFKTDRDGGGLWEQDLPAGEYRLMLMTSQSPGILSVYWGYR